MNKFFTKLSIGNHAENFVAEIFNKCANITSTVVVNEPYDIITIGDIHFTTEVKYDILEHRTGNIAIEYYNNKSNKPSGILATKAVLWCEVLFPKFAWITSTKLLKQFIKNNKPIKIMNDVGDGNADIALYKSYDILQSIFTRIDNLNEYDIINILRRKIDE